MTKQEFAKSRINTEAKVIDYADNETTRTEGQLLDQVFTYKIGKQYQVFFQAIERIKTPDKKQAARMFQHIVTTFNVK